MPFFLPFDHDSCTGHLVSGCDVKEYWLPIGGDTKIGGLVSKALSLSSASCASGV